MYEIEFRVVCFIYYYEYSYTKFFDASRTAGSLSTPSVAALGLLGFALRDSAAAPKARGGAHEGRHARGWGHPNPSRQRLRATPGGDELSRITSL